MPDACVPHATIKATRKAYEESEHGKVSPPACLSGLRCIVPQRCDAYVPQATIKAWWESEHEMDDDALDAEIEALLWDEIASGWEAKLEEAELKEAAQEEAELCEEEALLKSQCRPWGERKF